MQRNFRLLASSCMKLKSCQNNVEQSEFEKFAYYSKMVTKFPLKRTKKNFFSETIGQHTCMRALFNKTSKYNLLQMCLTRFTSVQLMTSLWRRKSWHSMSIFCRSIKNLVLQSRKKNIVYFLILTLYLPSPPYSGGEQGTGTRESKGGGWARSGGDGEGCECHVRAGGGRRRRDIKFFYNFLVPF